MRYRYRSHTALPFARGNGEGIGTCTLYALDLLICVIDALVITINIVIAFQIQIIQCIYACDLVQIPPMH